MKRFLLSALAVMATMGSFAQQKAADLNPVKFQKMDMAMPCVKQFKPTVANPAEKVMGPRKSFESEMWYVRPEGSFFLSGQYYDDNDELQSYKYLVVPPFTELKFLNASTDKADTKWFIGTTDLTDSLAYVDADRNYMGFLQAAHRLCSLYAYVEER